MHLHTMKDIQDWLDGHRNYTVGRLLYETFGEDAELKALFAEGPTEWNKTKLLTSMQELASGTQAKVELDEYSEMPKGADAVLQALHAEWQPLYQAMNYKRHELDKYQDDTPMQEAVRRSLAHEILSLERQCMAIWKKRDYYQEHGQLPAMQEKAAPVLTDPLAIGRRIETLKRNIRRNKQKTAKYPNNATYPVLVKQYESELEALSGGIST